MRAGWLFVLGDQDHEELYDEGYGPRGPRSVRPRPEEWDDPVIDALIIRVDAPGQAAANVLYNRKHRRVESTFVTPKRPVEHEGLPWIARHRSKRKMAGAAERGRPSAPVSPSVPVSIPAAEPIFKKSVRRIQVFDSEDDMLRSLL